MYSYSSTFVQVYEFHGPVSYYLLLSEVHASQLHLELFFVNFSETICF